jgi:spermidine synthase
MQPLELLGQSTTPDGSDLKLTRRTNEYIILANGKSLMSSRTHGSEEALATLACNGLRTADPCILIGGLGMGFTLRAALDVLPRDAKIIVAELVAAVVDWNRGPLGPLAGQPLKDKRVRVEVTDVANAIRSRRLELDAILLDVDNGPSAFTTTENSCLYNDRGLAAIHTALKRGGVLTVWSARDDRKFEQRLRYGGFVVEVKHVRARLKKGGPRHTIFRAQKPDLTSVPFH